MLKKACSLVVLLIIFTCNTVLAGNFAGKHANNNGSANFTGNVSGSSYAGSNAGEGGIAYANTSSFGLISFNMSTPGGVLKGSSVFDTGGFAEGFGPQESMSVGGAETSGSATWNMRKLPAMQFPMHRLRKCCD